MSNNNQEWKWGQVANNALTLVNQFFNADVQNLAQVKDKDVQKLLKDADHSDIQTKRVQDGVRAITRKWANQAQVGGMLHGLVRKGLTHVLTQRRQEATTAKEYAKLITATSVTSAQTTTAIERTYHKGAKQIEKSNKSLDRAKADIDARYEATEETANTAATTRRLGYRDRAQKRLAANSRPWRNY